MDFIMDFLRKTFKKLRNKFFAVPLAKLLYKQANLSFVNAS